MQYQWDPAWGRARRLRERKCVDNILLVLTILSQLAAYQPNRKAQRMQRGRSLAFSSIKKTVKKTNKSPRISDPAIFLWFGNVIFRVSWEWNDFFFLLKLLPIGFHVLFIKDIHTCCVYSSRLDIRRNPPSSRITQSTCYCKKGKYVLQERFVNRTLCKKLLFFQDIRSIFKSQTHSQGPILSYNN